MKKRLFPIKKVKGGWQVKGLKTVHKTKHNAKRQLKGWRDDN